MSEIIVNSNVPDQEMLDLYTASVDINEVDSKKYQILKMNNRPDSVYPKGTWVVGQKVQENKIISQGFKVTGMYILATRNRNNFFKEAKDKTPADSCSSHYFINHGTTVTGDKYGSCLSCPKKAKDIDKNLKCKSQRVVFAIAITTEGEKVPCMAYLQGSNYMPFNNFVKELSQVRLGNEVRQIALYSRMTIFEESKMEINGANDYYIAQYSLGQWVSKEMLKELDSLKAELDRTLKEATWETMQQQNTMPALQAGAVQAVEYMPQQQIEDSELAAKYALLKRAQEMEAREAADDIPNFGAAPTALEPVVVHQAPVTPLATFAAAIAPPVQATNVPSDIETISSELDILFKK